MAKPLTSSATRTLSVSEATARGVAGLVRDAETGDAVLLSRHGKTVAAVVSTERLEHLQDLEGELRDAALVLTRFATDTGGRTSIDEVITAFGCSRKDLEAELAADQASGTG